MRLNAPITPKSNGNRLKRRGDGNCLFYSLLGRDDAIVAAQLWEWVGVVLDGFTLEYGHEYVYTEALKSRI